MSQNFPNSILVTNLEIGSIFANPRQLATRGHAIGPGHSLVAGRRCFCRHARRPELSLSAAPPSHARGLTPGCPIARHLVVLQVPTVNCAASLQTRPGAHNSVNNGGGCVVSHHPPIDGISDYVLVSDDARSIQTQQASGVVTSVRGVCSRETNSAGIDDFGT